ncbi:MAG: hypothetical protein HMLKMBBP_00073 [Planctomycetes bacterium]|nr:hypothetical protein [Planctomycetota bacterium]
MTSVTPDRAAAELALCVQDEVGRADIPRTVLPSEEASMAGNVYVVATDLSSDSGKAAEVAARIASATGAKLDVFCAVHSAAADDAGVALERARAGADAVARRHADGAPGTTVSASVVDDVPGGILDHVRETGASLLVVAPHGVTGWKKVLLGSVTEQVIRRAKGAVLVARPGGTGELKRILVAIDRGAGAGPALRTAVSLARALGADVEVAHVASPARYLLPLVTPGAGTHHVGERLLAKITKDVERRVAAVPTGGKPVAVRVLEGSPAAMVVEEAQRIGADLVIVGTSERSRASRAVLGSVARAVASASPTSVLLVRGTPLA